MSSNIVTERKKVIISGESSKSVNDAARDAFRKLQSEVYKSTDLSIIYMKPVNVVVLENKNESYEEKFMMVLFPRTRNLYRLKLEVEVEMSLLNL